MSRPVLIAAVSGRALAAAARRAGYRPFVLDFFGDEDTRRLTSGHFRVAGRLRGGFDAATLLAGAEALEARMAGASAGLVCGSGFEGRPDLLARLARGRHLLGNRPAVVARLKDPRAFLALAERLGLPHPPTVFAAPADPRGWPKGWLVKRAGGAGGGHVRPAGEAVAGPGDYYQRRVRGRPVSALFLANGADARVLGLSEQWPARGAAGRGFLFGGAAAPAEIAPRTLRAAARMIARLAAATGLVGLNSADLLVRKDDFVVLEVNPRPGATLDIFDRAAPPGLFALHCAACGGDLPDAWPAPRGAAASAIVYARHRLRVPQGFAWPRWSADRPSAGTRIERGEPVCTVAARAGTAAAARAKAGQRVEEIRDRLRPAARSRRTARRAPPRQAAAP